MTQRRCERRPIIGASPGYQISADGTARKWNRLIPVTKELGKLPTISVDGHYLLLDEVVCHAFHGRPPHDIRGMTVTHFDGNVWNCAASNVAWRVDLDWLTSNTYLPLMRPSHLPRRVLFYGVK
jgi:hypothetical protein